MHRLSLWEPISEAIEYRGHLLNYNGERVLLYLVRGQDVDDRCLRDLRLFLRGRGVVAEARRSK